MRREWSERVSGRRGVVLIAATGLIFVLLAFVGLAFDVGYLQWQRRRAQTAADAAAMAGAWARATGGSMVDKGRQGSAMNGFTNGTDGIAVTLNHPPTAGSFAGNNRYVEAIVSQDTPSFFMRVLDWNSLPVRARAVANIWGIDTACIFALNPTAQSSLNFSGNVTLTLGCGAVAESTHDTRATDIGGNTTINLTNGATIGAVGTTNSSNGVTFQRDGVTVTAAEATANHVNSPGDPLVGMEMPTYDNQLCFNGTSMVTGPCAALSHLPNGTYQPGVYCGGISITSAGANVTFLPGLYIIVGNDGLQINSSSGTVTGTGVTFYLTAMSDSPAWPCTGLNGANGRIGAVTINSGPTVTLKAPNEDPYAGISIFSNRAITNTPASTINGGATVRLDGAIYMPNSDLNFAGSSSPEGYMLLIADKVNFTGNTTMYLNNFPTAFRDNFAAFKNWVTMAE